MQGGSDVISETVKAPNRSKVLDEISAAMASFSFFLSVV